MICPGRYKDMATGTGLSPDRPIMGADRRGQPADRLEAALDTCLIDEAETIAASLTRRPMMVGVHPVCVFSCHLPWMRGWLGDRWTKRAIAELFREKVVKRYMDGGWGECSVDCGAPSNGMVFRFSKAKVEASLYARGVSALADLGEILGVERCAGKDQESTVGYLEDLRLGARLMRFDLDATRREAGCDISDLLDDDDDGYWPPFEGSPDDDNFGNG